MSDDLHLYLALEVLVGVLKVLMTTKWAYSERATIQLIAGYVEGERVSVLLDATTQYQLAIVKSCNQWLPWWIQVDCEWH